MPILLASILRYIVMAAMNVAVIATAQALISEGINWITGLLQSEEGMSQAEAEDSVAAEVIGMAGAMGADAALLKSRLPVRIADKIATTKRRPTLSPLSKATSAAGAQGVASATLKSKLVSQVTGKWGFALFTTIVWLPSLVQNILDQGTFNPKGANNAMDSIGLPKVLRWKIPDSGITPGSYTAAEFLDLYDQLTSAGAVGINNELEQQSQMWSKNALADLIDVIVGDLIIRGKKSDKTAVKAELAKYIISRPASGGGSVISPYTAPAPVTPPAGYVPTQIKIYTGVVANGALGTPQEFVARPDDMIQNAEELKAAAKINLAALYQALPGRFYYEIAIVSSVRTRAGFTVKGAPVQVVSGYTTKGTPRYKTVYHKFAVMRIFVTDRLGKNVKLEEITLGPVNVVDFQPTAAQLTDIAEKITPETFTGDIGDVSQIVTTKPVSVTPTSQYVPAPTTAPAGGTVSQPVASVPQVPAYVAPATPPPAPPPVQVSSPAPAPVPVAPQVAQTVEIWRALGYTEMQYGGIGNLSIATLATKYGVDPNDFGAINPQFAKIGGISAGSSWDASYLMRNMGIMTINIPQRRTVSLPPVNAQLMAATNLSEAYAALGLSLAALSTRANLYQAWGLGAASTYAGTAEQNAKLLAEIKKRGTVS